jgi:hypothetical protein
MHFLAFPRQTALYRCYPRATDSVNERKPPESKALGSKATFSDIRAMG